jgi:hypothetical protein
MHLFKNKDFTILTIVSAVGGMLYYSLNGKIIDASLSSQRTNIDGQSFTQQWWPRSSQPTSLKLVFFHAPLVAAWVPVSSRHRCGLLQAAFFDGNCSSPSLRVRPSQPVLQEQRHKERLPH